MHSASNFHPEWGCLSPSPNLIRSVCIALVATAVGATSGAIVMNALLVPPGSNDAIPSLAARALARNAPVIVAPVGTASFINASAAAALIARSVQAKPAVADTPQPAPDATSASGAASGACVLTSAQTPSGTASPAAGHSSGNAAGSTERRSTARVAKAEAKRKGLPPKRHWQTTTSGKNYRYYDQSFGPSFRRPDDRSFGQFGYSEQPHDW